VRLLGFTVRLSGRTVRHGRCSGGTSGRLAASSPLLVLSDESLAHAAQVLALVDPGSPASLTRVLTFAQVLAPSAVAA
jgi:hypothetical protein